MQGGCFVLVGGWVCRRCTRRGACLLCRLPTPPLACFPAPLPRRGRIDPRPPSPAGKGETKVISCKGLRPLHPRAEPKRRWEQGRTTHPAGACPAGRRLTLPPLYPAGGVPALSPAAPAISAPAGGLAFFLACLPCLGFTFLPPIPPTPFPGGEGGDFRLFYARGFAPCIPGAEPMVRRKTDRKRLPMSSAGSQGEGGPGERNFGV